MKEIIKEVIKALDECSDPIKDFKAREIRDNKLSVLADKLKFVTRDQVESYGTNPKDSMGLHWFYTRFVHNRVISARGDSRENRK